MDKVSACIIIYNEEKNIEECLKRIQFCVDEIILVHDGNCQDKSLQIAKKYTNKIFIQERKGFCEAHYAFAFSQAKHNWILKLDADELLSKKLQKNLKKIISSGQASRYLFLWTEYNKDKSKIHKNTNYYKPFLFYKPDMISVGILHFPIISKGISMKLNYHVYHLSRPLKVSLKKIKKWSKLHAKQLITENYSSFQGNKNNYNLRPRHYLFIKYPLMLGPIRALTIIIRITFNQRLCLKNMHKSFKTILGEFIYNILLAKEIHKQKRNQ